MAKKFGTKFGDAKFGDGFIFEPFLAGQAPRQRSTQSVSSVIVTFWVKAISILMAPILINSGCRLAGFFSPITTKPMSAASQPIDAARTDVLIG